MGTHTAKVDNCQHDFDTVLNFMFLLLEPARSEEEIVVTTDSQCSYVCQSVQFCQYYNLFIYGWISGKFGRVVLLNPWFLRVCSICLSKTLWEKGKLLVTSNFSFSHSVFSPLGELSTIFIGFKIVVCKLFNFARS